MEQPAPARYGAVENQLFVHFHCNDYGKAGHARSPITIGAPPHQSDGWLLHLTSSFYILDDAGFFDALPLEKEGLDPSLVEQVVRKARQDCRTGDELLRQATRFAVLHRCVTFANNIVPFTVSTETMNTTRMLLSWWWWWQGVSEQHQRAAARPLGCPRRTRCRPAPVGQPCRPARTRQRQQVRPQPGRSTRQRHRRGRQWS